MYYGHSLYHILKENTLSIDVIVHILKQIAEGLKFIHKKGYIYYDLKPDNIVFKEEYDSKNTTPEIRLVDFGTLTKYNPKKSVYKGTSTYMAYEVSKLHSNVTNKADVFSFGMLILNLLYPK